MQSFCYQKKSLDPFNIFEESCCVLGSSIPLLFTDLLGMNAGGPGSALGFQFYGGPLVTMLASKTSRKYTTNMFLIFLYNTEVPQAEDQCIPSPDWV